MNRIKTLIVAFLLQSSLAFACTSFQVQAQDGTRLYCRSMEFSFAFDSNLLVVPRGMPFVGTAPEGKPGAQWTTKYGYVGMNVALAPTLVADGMNEKGLVAGTLYLPQYAKFQNTTPAEYNRTIGAWEVCSYLLGTCATVSEAKEAIKKIIVANEPLPTTDNFIIPLHFTIQDATGACAIIEYVKGKRTIYNNSLGVLTNSPPFDWHLMNLSNYVKLSPENTQTLKLGKYTISNPSQGTGLLGIPGDFSPVSRFIRATFFAHIAEKPNTADELVNLGFHILNTFDIFNGAIHEAPQAAPTSPVTNASSLLNPSDTTQWVIAHDMNNLNSYFRTYEDLRIKKVDLKKLNFDAKDYMVIKVDTKIVFDEVTNHVLSLDKKENIITAK